MLLLSIYDRTHFQNGEEEFTFSGLELDLYTYSWSRFNRKKIQKSKGRIEKKEETDRNWQKLVLTQVNQLHFAIMQLYNKKHMIEWLKKKREEGTEKVVKKTKWIEKHYKTFESNQ